MYPHLGLRLAYHGKNFHGFQLQDNQPSVQAAVENALEILFRKPVRLKFTSRTDSGVHAIDQFAIVPNGYDLFLKLPKKQQAAFQVALNALLRPSISVHGIYKLHKDFSPKTDVSSKEYSYKVFVSPVWDPTLEETWLWVRGPIDFRKMNSARKEFIGEHDFASFAKSSGIANQKSKRGSWRRVTRIQIKKTRHLVIPNAYFVEFIFEADGFLRHMVRNMVGTLIDIGRGKQIRVSEVLKMKSRIHAGRAMPASGLLLRRTHLKKRLMRRLAPHCI